MSPEVYMRSHLVHGRDADLHDLLFIADKHHMHALDNMSHEPTYLWGSGQMVVSSMEDRSLSLYYWSLQMHM